MMPKSYLDLELIASDMFNQLRSKEKKRDETEGQLGGGPASK
jgi:hypothetical protein